MSRLNIYAKKLDSSTSSEVLSDNEIFIDSSDDQISIYSDGSYKTFVDTTSVLAEKADYESELLKLDNIRDIIINEPTFYMGELYILSRYLDIVKHYHKGMGYANTDWYRCPESFVLDIVDPGDIKHHSAEYNTYMTETIPETFTHIVFRASHPVDSTIDIEEGLAWHLDNLELKANHIFRSITYPMHAIQESWYIDNDILYIIYKTAIDRNAITDNIDFNACEGIKLELIDNSVYSGKTNVTPTHMDSLAIDFYGVNRWADYAVADNFGAQIDNVIE